MPFTDKQIRDLEAPLQQKFVSDRKQAGRKLSYIEGWHAIAEANRIFGFDGWDRRTTEMKMVHQGERMIGKDNPKPGWGVSYIASVTIMVTPGEGAEPVQRTGWGAGHGIDTDLGLAHESATKEAETDAMKRALMTFGNPFGLALYDKTQSNVASYDVARIEEFEEQIDAATDDQQIADTLAEYDPDLSELYAKEQGEWQRLSAKVRARRKELKGDPAHALPEDPDGKRDGEHEKGEK